MKRLICFVLCGIITMGLCSCKQDSNNSNIHQGTASDQQNTRETINLLYKSTDTLNPYTAITSENKKITTLIFDPLIKVDNNFEAHYYLAQSVEIVDKVCTVTLREAYFTDGTAVTSADVVYSYNQCISSQNEYAANFYEVSSVEAPDNKTVVFNLTQCDEYFINLLEFPIVKRDSCGNTDTDGMEILPIGCGRYYVSEDKKSLNINTSYYGKGGQIHRITLTNAPDEAAATHYVEVGATHIYYTDADDGNIIRMSAKKTEVNLNRLVYIGINSSYGSLKTKEMRYAISSALDRAAICKSAYYNNATAATGFFSPYFTPTQPVQTLLDKPNTEITVENLGKIGYNDLNGNGYYANFSGNNPTFTLLVNTESTSRMRVAELIKSQCAAAGIEISVISVPYDQYVAMLEANSFQLYLGEIRILNNMDLTQLVVSGGTAAYGVGLESVTEQVDAEAQDAASDAEQAVTLNSASMLESYHKGVGNLSDISSALLAEMPQIPICYRNGLLFYSSDITSDVVATANDIYFSIENYSFN